MLAQDSWTLVANLQFTWMQEINILNLVQTYCSQECTGMQTPDTLTSSKPCVHCCYYHQTLLQTIVRHIQFTECSNQTNPQVSLPKVLQETPRVRMFVSRRYWSKTRGSPSHLWDGGEKWWGNIVTCSYILITIFSARYLFWNSSKLYISKTNNDVGTIESFSLYICLSGIKGN